MDEDRAAHQARTRARFQEVIEAFLDRHDIGIDEETFTSTSCSRSCNACRRSSPTTAMRRRSWRISSGAVACTT